jgi:hypothetical protein
VHSRACHRTESAAFAIACALSRRDLGRSTKPPSPRESWTTRTSPSSSPSPPPPKFSAAFSFFLPTWLASPTPCASIAAELGQVERKASLATQARNGLLSIPAADCTVRRREGQWAGAPQLAMAANADSYLEPLRWHILRSAWPSMMYIDPDFLFHF